MEDGLEDEFKRLFLRLFVLKIISERPIHGYEIIKTIEARTSCHWVPSAGSIYPILKYLEKNNFIVSNPNGRKKIYAITPDGSVALKRMTEENRQLIKKMAKYIDVLSRYVNENV